MQCQDYVIFTLYQYSIYSQKGTSQIVNREASSEEKQIFSSEKDSMHTAILFLLYICITVSLTGVNCATPASFYTPMIDIDTQWGLNFTARFGSPDVACNCSDNGVGGIYPCTWVLDSIQGFFCSGSPTTGTVTKIEFTRPLPAPTAPFSNNLSSLTSLVTLILVNTNLTGSIPSLDTLLSLQTLQVSGNPYLTGPLALLPPSLVTLDFSNNTITGGIPNTYNSLTSLETVNLSNNQLTGPIPLTKVVTLNVANNHLSGSLPPFGAQLRYLTVTNNNLTGTVPDTLFTSLITCQFSSNNFTFCGNLTILTLNSNCSIDCPYADCPPGIPPIPEATCDVINGHYAWHTNQLPTTTVVTTGTLIITNNVTQYNNSSLTINGDNGGKPFLQIEGVLTLNGQLIVNVTFTGNNVILINATGINGNFSSISLPSYKCKIVTPVNDGTSFGLLLSDDTTGNCKNSNTTGNNKTGNSGLSNKIKYIIVACSVAVVALVILVGVALYLRYPHVTAFRQNIREGSTV